MKRSNLIVSILIHVVVALWLTACVDDEYTVVPPAQPSSFTFKVSVPDTRTPSSTPSTRGMAGAGNLNKEDEIERIDLLIFDASDPDNEIFVDRVKIDAGITQDFSQPLSIASFTATLARRDNASRIVFIANMDIDGMVAGFSQKSKKEVMEALIHSTTGSSPDDWKWKANGGSESGYTRIPMYGEVLLKHIKPDISLIEAVDLTRMLARIDIQNSADNFVIEKVYLVNYSTVGYVAPAWNPSTGQLLNPQPYEPLIPGNSGKKTGEANAITYTLDGLTEYAGEIYTYESAANINSIPSEDGYEYRKDATCLIIKGQAEDGKSYYYRVDFTTQGENSTEYLPLKRNYKYVVDIQQADGKGYENISEAIGSYTVMSNLKSRVISYNRKKINNIAFNGQYMLGLGESEMIFDKTGTQYTGIPGTIDVFTDNPSGWEATVDADWITLDIATGVANDDNSKVLFHVMNATTTEGDIDEREATITITAGRLTNTVKVKQVASPYGTIKVVDAYGNEVNHLFFSSEAPEAQTVYVVWDAANCQASAVYPEDNSHLIEYDGAIPLPRAGTGVGQPITLYGRIEAIKIQPLPSDRHRWDTYYFDIYNENWSSHYRTELKIDQAYLDFKINNERATGYSFGKEYTLQLSSNASWKIDGVTFTDEYDNLIADYGDIIVGNECTVPSNESVVTSLTFKTGEWLKGKNGILRVSFEITYSISGEVMVFNRTLEIKINSSWFDYTGGNNSSSASPRFYVYPEPYIDPSTNYVEQLSYQGAQTKLNDLGDEWEIPTMSDLLLSYAYMNAVGGTQDENRWFSGDRHWSSTTIDNSGYLTVSDNYTGTTAQNEISAFRFVNFNSSPQSTIYPRIDEDTEGVIIISREGNNGVDPSVLFLPGEIPDGSEDMNKVAPKLLVSKADDSESVSWEEAKRICEEKSGGGWRLPTQREGFLIWGLGGYTTGKTVGNSGHDDVYWPDSFSKLDNNYWFLNSVMEGSDEKARVFQAPEVQMINVTKGTDSWIRARCVKSIN